MSADTTATSNKWAHICSRGESGRRRTKTASRAAKAKYARRTETSWVSRSFDDTSTNTAASAKTVSKSRPAAISCSEGKSNRYSVERYRTGDLGGIAEILDKFDVSRNSLAGPARHRPDNTVKTGDRSGAYSAGEVVCRAWQGKVPGPANP